MWRAPRLHSRLSRCQGCCPSIQRSKLLVNMLMERKPLPLLHFRHASSSTGDSRVLHRHGKEEENSVEMVDCEDATGDWAPVDLQVSMRQLVVYALPTSTASKSPHGRMLPGHPLLSADCMRLLKGETLNLQLLEREESHVTRGGHHDPTTITPEPVSPQSPQSLETPSGNTNQDKDLHGALLRAYFQ